MSQANMSRHERRPTQPPRWTGADKTVTARILR